MTTIQSVDTYSPAFKAGVKPGELLASINGHEIIDVLDYRFYSADNRIVLETHTPGGKVIVRRVKNPEFEPLGLNFETYLIDKPKGCANKCVFCFIDQLPDGLRDTLYFKDDDARLSFLQGNYITLTNLSERELDRIIALRISPIHVSVHTTNPELRVKMMGNKLAADIMPRLKRLADGGIE
ncbi:MAG: radical SAM protein, partial [Oscillospiraceae bacterium]|nr:radical SAM protein [Oscillospiraceae bacterium]